MAKKYTYTDSKTGRVLYETVEPNHVMMDTIDRKVLNVSGRDPRLDPHISIQIRVVPDNIRRTK